jgi:hypothetical protein
MKISAFCFQPNFSVSLLIAFSVLLIGGGLLPGCSSGPPPAATSGGLPPGSGDPLYQFQEPSQAKVDLHRSGRTFTPTLAAGEKLFEQDEVHNTAPGLVAITGTLDDCRFGLQPGAKIKLAKQMVQLSQGKTRLTFRKVNGVFRVQVPFATLGIRGTEFDVTIGEGGKALVQMIEGKIEITRGEETATLEGTNACLIGAPGTPLEYPSADDLPDFLKGLPKGAEERAIQKF